MTTHLYLAFVAASVVLILLPGPNVAVIVASSVKLGTRHGLLAVAGVSAAMIFHLAATVLGLFSLLSLFAQWFEWIRWLGVAYLLYLGIKAWIDPVLGPSSVAASSKTTRQTFTRAFLVSFTNPKTLLFYAALFPQFVDPAGDRTAQLVTLAVTFLAIAISLDSTWAVLAGRLHTKFRLQSKSLNRLTGSVLLSGAVGLALARRP